MPLVAYVDFETTAPTGNCFNPEEKKMFVVSYVIVFDFHPKLNLDRVIFQRSFGHSLKKLTTIYYLSNDQMECIDVKLVKKLKDCAICVSQKCCKNAVAQMFSVELKFVADCLLTWFNEKFRSQHVEIDLSRKIAYKANSPISWDKNKCFICNFPIQINAKGPHVPNPKMSYTDFYIRFEHTFLRNIYSREELASSTYLSIFENYYKIYESTLNNNLTFDEIADDELVDFLKEKCADCENFEDLTEGINKTKVKHSTKNGKMPKFTQKLYAFVYSHLINFPE